MIQQLIVNQPIVLFDATCFLYIHGARSDYKRSVTDHIQSTLEACNSKYYVGFLDGKVNFRNDVSVSKVYKGNRDKTDILEKFPFFYRVKEYLKEEFGFITIDGIEADDAVGILNSRLNKQQSVTIIDPFTGEPVKRELITYKSIIASIDKDLPQLNGMHYNLKTHEFTHVTDSSSYIKLNMSRSSIKGTGYKFLYSQVLTGDTVDNIEGLPKYGPVKAFNLLKNCNTEQECRNKVIEEYKKVYKDEKVGMEKFTEMFTLVYILRHSNTLGEVKIRKLDY